MGKDDSEQSGREAVWGCRRDLGHPPMLTQQMREVEPLRPVTANLHHHLMGPILLSERWGNKNEPLV